MIDGVKIISEKIVHSESIGEIIFFIIAALIMLACWIYVSQDWLQECESKFGKAFFYLSYLVLAAVIIIGSPLKVYKYNHSAHIRYTVSITDECKFNEFFDTYKIISYEDGVYEIEHLDEGEISQIKSNF